MTEGSFEDVNSLVLVPAQVMTRDDSSGGWVPMGGGGLSKVSVRKRMVPSEEDTKHEYLIFGKRISDQMVVLSCKIKKDFQYNKVMPTFHHWKTGNKKFGLTFQTAADARAFDKGVRRAVEDLLEGSAESTQIHDPDVGDDDVFMAVDLPVEQGDSQSSSGSSSVGGGTNGGGRPMTGSYLGVSMMGDHPSSSPYTHPHANQHYLHRVHYLPKPTAPRMGLGGAPSTNNNGSGGSAFIIQEQLRKEQQQQHEVEDAWARLSQQQPTHKMDGSRESKLRDSDKIEIASDSYVHFAPERPSLHEYSYPNVDAVKSGCGDVRHQVAASKKLKGDNVVVVSQPPPLPMSKSKWKRDQKRGKLKHLLINRVSCKYCQESFCEEDNERGSCEYAPDRVRSCINTVTCLSCAQCMLYHCMSDAEGDFAHHPCTCDRSDENCSRRWLGLAVLSFFVPCLWCYLPLSTCHRCSVRYGMCGGRHKAS